MNPALVGVLLVLAFLLVASTGRLAQVGERVAATLDRVDDTLRLLASIEVDRDKRNADELAALRERQRGGLE